jgi:hypothetical protein
MEDIDHLLVVPLCVVFRLSRPLDFCEKFVEKEDGRDLVPGRCTPHDIVEEIDHPLVVPVRVVCGAI